MLSQLHKSSHQQHVESFMLRARQDVPVTPTIPSVRVRVLRAKLILEEALETIEALGVTVSMHTLAGGINHINKHRDLDYMAMPDEEFDLVEVIDGCCDIKVVTTGTLSACGIPDEPFQQLVDANNLSKFGPGHTFRQDGKIVKPPGHEPPPILAALRQLCYANKLGYAVCGGYVVPTGLPGDEVDERNPYAIQHSNRTATQGQGSPSNSQGSSRPASPSPGGSP